VPTNAVRARGGGEYEEEKGMKRTSGALVAMMLLVVFLAAGPALAAPVLEISEAAEILVRAHLIACGYHRHKGEWRRRARGER
jgi:hypothetical protein